MLCSPFCSIWSSLPSSWVPVSISSTSRRPLVNINQIIQALSSVHHSTTSAGSPNSSNKHTKSSKPFRNRHRHSPLSTSVTLTVSANTSMTLTLPSCRASLLQNSMLRTPTNTACFGRSAYLRSQCLCRSGSTSSLWLSLISSCQRLCRGLTLAGMSSITLELAPSEQSSFMKYSIWDL